LSLVSFVDIQNAQSVKQAIKTSLDLIDFSFPRSLKKIVIKPNMCYYWDYSTGHTTDPRFVGQIIDVIREFLPNIEICLVEADASAMKCNHAFKVLGYEKLSQDYRVNLVNLSEDKTENIIVTVNGYEFNLKLPETIISADLKINVPKPKYMDKTTITCSLKNIFGCNPEPLKYKLHPMLDEAIVAVNQVMKFDLNILDGIIVTGASTRRLNLLMASQDPVAFDSATAKLMGENPKRIRHLKIAEKQGLGKTTYVSRGANPESFSKLYPKRKFVSKFLLKGYKAAIKTGLLKTDLL
jgi:uncharacterized protein (DUF362 family)